MGKIDILSESERGSSRKTTIAINLAHAFLLEKNKTLFLDSITGKESPLKY